MRTHEVARTLTELARAMRKAPNQPLEEFFEAQPQRAALDPNGIPAALSTLVALASFGRSQWRDIISDYGFPITVRPRDTARDLFTRVLQYLEENPDAREALVKSSSRPHSGTSPELTKALRFLLDS